MGESVSCGGRASERCVVHEVGDGGRYIPHRQSGE